MSEAIFRPERTQTPADPVTLAGTAAACGNGHGGNPRAGSDIFPMTDVDPRVEADTQALGRALFDRVDAHRPSPFTKTYWEDRLVGAVMGDPAVKVQLFRLVDVLPMLASGESVIRHLQEYLLEVSDHLPPGLRWLLKRLKPGSYIGNAVASVARQGALGHARKFMAGENAQQVLRTAWKERQRGRAFTLDLLGEAVVSESEADRYLQSYLDLIDQLGRVVNAWPEVPGIDRAGKKVLPRINVSLKLSALDSHFDPLDRADGTRRVAARLRQVLRAARGVRGFVNVDMESYETKDLVRHIFMQVLAEPEFKDWPDVGIVVQCYLRSADNDLLELQDWAKRRGTPIWVRLVKGAYWDYETAHASSQGWPIPVYQQKWQSDASFERISRLTVQAFPHLNMALGSHNLRSLAHGMAAARAAGLPDHALELQMLYGMADQEKQALVDQGYRMRIYMPFGELIPGMAYLVRRLLENTSNDSFLRASFAEHVDREKLLMNPQDQGGLAQRALDASAAGGNQSAGNAHAPALHAAEQDHSDHAAHGAHAGPHADHLNFHVAEMPDHAADSRGNASHGNASHAATASQAAAGATSSARQFPWVFKNEPLSDFAQAASRDALAYALEQAQQQLGRRYALIIDGQAVETSGQIVSVNPSDCSQYLGTVCAASPAECHRAVAAAKRAWPAWANRTAQERAAVLRKLAAVIRRRKFEMAAWQILECGKPWREADGDVAEAIDFCEYYADGAELLAQDCGVDLPGEQNRFVYDPRGVAVVIAPWNFPLAILTGMVVAALVTGNTVVIKPAEQSSIVAAKLMEALAECDLPQGVVNFVPGLGEVAGAALVDHPDTAIIAFTGSRTVGMAIHRRAAEVSQQAGYHVKKVIAEMGGKNAIIIDDDADLDEAVLGVVKSAFGFQGQKCSACSRAIVLEPIHDLFLRRLVDTTSSLRIGPAKNPATHLGPVIDAESQARVQSYIALGRQEGKAELVMDVGPLAQTGHFVGQAIFSNVSPNARLAQEEIFGPVLAVIKAKDLSEALAITNGTSYALTGGIYSRSPANLARARREAQVGNFYINRPITGALVSRQPFGGFRMSGIGSKAGGPDYLLQFVVPRTITENTMRRGFTPEIT